MIEQVATRNNASEFTGCVEQLPPLQPGEKLVLSQVLVPPLAQQYETVKAEWMRQERWKDNNFIELLTEGSSDAQAKKLCHAVEEYLEMHMDMPTRQLKLMDQPSWRLLLVNSFESSLADPAVSSKVEKYTVPHTDPCTALRGELGLRTTQASKMFAVGVYRSRTMAELPTYMEYERTHPPAGFPHSVYRWVVKLDQYAVDGPHFVPDWMAAMEPSKPATKKRKSKPVQTRTAMWEEGYRLVHSAFGYGNETVLANDPHEHPFTSLDDPQAIEDARAKSNTCVKCFRIGPWAFPIEFTDKALPAGTPLLYFYDRDYWSTARASLALANISDARESELLSRNTELVANCATVSTEKAQLKAKNASIQMQLQKLMTLHLKVAKELVEPSRFWELPGSEQDAIASEQVPNASTIIPSLTPDTPLAEHGIPALSTEQMTASASSPDAAKVATLTPASSAQGNISSGTGGLAELPKRASCDVVLAVSAKTCSPFASAADNAEGSKALQAAKTASVSAGLYVEVNDLHASIAQMQARLHAMEATTKQLTSQHEARQEQGSEAAELAAVWQSKDSSTGLEQNAQARQPGSQGQATAAHLQQDGLATAQSAAAKQVCDEHASCSQQPVAASAPVLDSMACQTTATDHHCQAEKADTIQPTCSEADLCCARNAAAPHSDAAGNSAAHSGEGIADHTAAQTNIAKLATAATSESLPLRSVDSLHKHSGTQCMLRHKSRYALTVNSLPKQLPENPTSDVPTRGCEELQWGAKRPRKRARNDTWIMQSTQMPDTEAVAAPTSSQKPPTDFKGSGSSGTVSHQPHPRPASMKPSMVSEHALSHSKADASNAEAIAGEVEEAQTAVSDAELERDDDSGGCASGRASDVVGPGLVWGVEKSLFVDIFTPPKHITFNTVVMPAGAWEVFLTSSIFHKVLGIHDMKRFYKQLHYRIMSLNACRRTMYAPPRLPQKAYLPASSRGKFTIPRYVFAEVDVLALLIPGLLDDKARTCLQRLHKDVWSSQAMQAAGTKEGPVTIPLHSQRIAKGGCFGVVAEEPASPLSHVEEHQESVEHMPGSSLEPPQCDSDDMALEGTPDSCNELPGHDLDHTALDPTPNLHEKPAEHDSAHMAHKGVPDSRGELPEREVTGMAAQKFINTTDTRLVRTAHHCMAVFTDGSPHVQTVPVYNMPNSSDQLYLLLSDIFQMLGMSKPSHVRRRYRQLNAQAAKMAAGQHTAVPALHCPSKAFQDSSAEKPCYVLGKEDVLPLLLPGLLEEHNRLSLQRLAASVWGAKASASVSSEPATEQTSQVACHPDLPGTQAGPISSDTPMPSQAAAKHHISAGNSEPASLSPSQTAQEHTARLSFESRADNAASEQPQGSGGGYELSSECEFRPTAPQPIADLSTEGQQQDQPADSPGQLLHCPPADASQEVRAEEAQKLVAAEKEPAPSTSQPANHTEGYMSEDCNRTSRDKTGMSAAVRAVLLATLSYDSLPGLGCGDEPASPEQSACLREDQGAEQPAAAMSEAEALISNDHSISFSDDGFDVALECAADESNELQQSADKDVQTVSSSHVSGQHKSYGPGALQSHSTQTDCDGEVPSSMGLRHKSRKTTQTASAVASSQQSIASQHHTATKRNRSRSSDDIGSQVVAKCPVHDVIDLT